LQSIGAGDISILLDRFDHEQGRDIKRSTPGEVDDHRAKVMFWVSALAGESITKNDLEEVYVKLIRKRAELKAQDKFVSSKLTPEDFLAVWLNIKIQRHLKVEESKPKELHACKICEASGEIRMLNPANIEEDVLMPCFSCRKEDHDKKRRELIGGVKPLEILDNVVKFRQKEKT
jgi:hypothetical protein